MIIVYYIEFVVHFFKRHLWNILKFKEDPRVFALLKRKKNSKKGTLLTPYLFKPIFYTLLHRHTQE